ncbi:hypothetical protein DVA67_011160 [Solirubrobacter sp. CPCC 204708]|uniref:Uncharacterized protein n=1 Tax=Solirubrobacter deserti TaxID=2282478 RepID=A0ABT4RHR1_9ACTN|nr:hypothetical protein [Solirubrobacter deserti]MBE2316537.1 hypothetical protein [Solirubrobacter deserti]MDA0138071.1 hypothetical protein [Solirubrobacter deserti]
MHVTAGHIQDWIQTHDALVCTLPWFPAVQDWSAIDHVRVHLDDADLWDHLARTPVGTHEHAFFAWAAGEPGVIAPLRAIVRDVDVLTWGVRGWRYFCGTWRERGGWTLAPSDFGAYAGGDHLTLRSGRRPARSQTGGVARL